MIVHIGVGVMFSFFKKNKIQEINEDSNILITGDIGSGLGDSLLYYLEQGLSKQKNLLILDNRGDLRILGLAIMITKSFNYNFFYHQVKDEHISLKFNEQAPYVLYIDTSHINELKTYFISTKQKDIVEKLLSELSVWKDLKECNLILTLDILNNLPISFIQDIPNPKICLNYSLHLKNLDSLFTQNIYMRNNINSFTSSFSPGEAVIKNKSGIYSNKNIFKYPYLADKYINQFKDEYKDKEITDCIQIV